MGRLKAAQAHVTEYILHQRAIFAPIRRVPDDILMRIFEESAGPVTRYGTFAWTLTAVCKRWRAVGFACASLWSCIEFDGTEVRDWQIDMISDIFETALIQSRGALLDLAYDSPRTYLERMARIHKIFTASSHLWRTAFFTFDDMEDDLTWFTKADMSNLESLMISSNIYSVAWGFGYTPKLKRLALYLRKIQRSIGPDGYIWSQLTHLELGFSTNLHLYLEILRAAENLESLDIQKLSLDVPDSAGQPQRVDLVPLKLPQIRKLYVSGEDPEFISYLVLPHLTELQLCRHGSRLYTSTSTPNDFISLFKRSACNPLKLTLNASVDEFLAIPLLQATPSIEILQISNARFPRRNAILEQLVIDDNPRHDAVSCILPNLRSL
ncbi:hypothetical protein M422DRAFT_49721 [Sphaerobolus stellatus SS14]|uniref:Unplaced genomic scaffold SPHSTscaffold_79, whole genome shotgun sequence n=1 Tax=Sphaerobolus stellatus (strain SS14) TaxID=990650 RepID=A0A0C9VN82_SPHS4|nr:hypothetical protein M422DRAFT_49721 [Sphaerobolus stellatus SS14]